MIYFRKNILSLTCISLMLVLSVYALFQDVFLGLPNNFPQGENHVAILLDVSKSMNISDMGGETRLTAAKKHILSQVRQLNNYEFSLIVFAGESQRILPFTSDVNLLSTFLLGLDYRNVTKQGTNIDSALFDASESFLEGMTGDIFLYTDGDESDVVVSQETLTEIDEKQLIVHVIPVGTVEGGVIPSGNPLSPYKTYQGKVVKQGVNKQGLQALSIKSSGEYHDFETKDILGDSHTPRGNAEVSRTLLLLGLLWIITIFRTYLQMYPRIGKNS